MIEDEGTGPPGSALDPAAGPGTAARAISPRGLGPLILISIGTLVWNVDASIFSVLLPDIRRTLGLTLGAVGLLGAIFSIANLVEPAVAYLGDRIRRTFILVGEMILLAVFTGMAGVAGYLSSTALMYVSRGGMGIATSVGSTRQSLLTDYYAPADRSTAFYALSYPQIVGALIGPLLAGVIGSRMGWEAPFVILAVPAFLLAGVLAAGLREPPRGRFELASVSSRRAPSFKRSVGSILSRPTMRWFYVSLACAAVSILGMSTFAAVFFREAFDVDTAKLGVIVSGSSAAQLAGLSVGLVAVGWAMRRGTRRALGVIGAMVGVMAICLAILPFAPNAATAIAAYLVLSGTIGSLVPGMLAVVANVLPPSVRTFGFGLTTLTYLLAIPFLPVLGFVGDRYGVRLALAATAPMAVVALLTIVRMSRSVEADMARVSEA